ncbi:MAG: Na+/H+ antiporter subunit C [Oscillochloris sp.]|nr:Na+/H+ antiporter subunit C [Oscillochloris sp.]
MTLLLALSIAVLFGCAAALLLKRDLIRVVTGVTLLSYGTNLFLMGSALREGRPPIFPIEESAMVADPLVQALTLTAIVIGLGTTVVLLSLVYRIYRTHGAIDQISLGAAERRTEQPEVDDGGDAELEEIVATEQEISR